MANVCFYMIAFNSDHVLEPVLKTITPFGPVVIAEGPVTYWQRRGYTTSTDNTNAILHDYLPFANILHGQWREKDQMQRAAESLIPDDTTHVWIVDADECYHASQMRLVLSWLDNLDSVSFRTNSFWAGFYRIIGGFEEDYEVHRIKRWYPGATFATHRPPTVLDRAGVPMREKRHLNHDQTDDLGIRMYHYSYVYPSQVTAKHAYYRDRDPSGCIANWPESVYRAWLDDPDGTEKLWHGVHNQIPARRGDTFTRPFSGKHPEHIDRALPRLRGRLAMEQKGMA